MIKKIVDQILDSKSKFIAIDGIDASGKTYFANQLKSEFEKQASVLLISLDDFHAPKEERYKLGKDSPIGFYNDSYQYSRFIDLTIKPILNYETRIVSKIFNLENDKEQIEYSAINENTIVIIEGIFLHRKELREFWDYSVFLDVDFEESYQRNLNRSLIFNPNLNQNKYKKRWKNRYCDGQKLYFELENPKSNANLIIDNNDYLNHKLITIH
jgi:uridine kinase